VKSKASEMRKKDKGDLLKELEQLRSELHKLRVAQVTGGTPAKLAQMYVTWLSFRFSADSLATNSANLLLSC
jgi:ribosomal protein L29